MNQTNGNPMSQTNGNPMNQTTQTPTNRNRLNSKQTDKRLRRQVKRKLFQEQLAILSLSEDFPVPYATEEVRETNYRARNKKTTGLKVNISSKALHHINTKAGPMTYLPDDLVFLRQGSKPEVVVEIGKVLPPSEPLTPSRPFRIRFGRTILPDTLTSQEKLLSTEYQRLRENKRAAKRRERNKKFYNNLNSWTRNYGVIPYTITKNSDPHRSKFHNSLTSELNKRNTSVTPPFTDPVGQILTDFNRERYGTHYIFFNDFHNSTLVQLAIYVRPTDSTITATTFDTSGIKDHPYINSKNQWLFNDFGHTASYHLTHSVLTDNQLTKTEYTSNSIHSMLIECQYKALIDELSNLVALAYTDASKQKQRIQKFHKLKKITKEP